MLGVSAEICLSQRLSARNEYALHFVQNLANMESVWNTKDGDIKYVFVGCA